MRTISQTKLVLAFTLAIISSGYSKSLEASTFGSICVVDKIISSDPKAKISKEVRDATCNDPRQTEVLELIHKNDILKSDGFELKFEGAKGGVVAMRLNKNVINNEGSSVTINKEVVNALHGIKLKEMFNKMTKK